MKRNRPDLEAKEEVKEIVDFLKKKGAQKIEIFGSFAKGEEDEDSDVDVIVDIPSVTGFEFFGLDRELTEKVGRKVELFTDDSLHHLLRDKIKNGAVVVFER